MLLRKTTTTRRAAEENDDARRRQRRRRRAGRLKEKFRMDVKMEEKNGAGPKLFRAPSFGAGGRPHGGRGADLTPGDGRS
jgi:hypothetical protein